ncbi:MAG: hypothetical protein ACI8RP_000080 [Urechidicola sp.]|jgi:hypothetical protein
MESCDFVSVEFPQEVRLELTNNEPTLLRFQSNYFTDTMVINVNNFEINNFLTKILRNYYFELVILRFCYSVFVIVYILLLSRFWPFR